MATDVMATCRVSYLFVLNTMTRTSDSLWTRQLSGIIGVGHFYNNKNVRSYNAVVCNNCTGEGQSTLQKLKGVMLSVREEIAILDEQLAMQMNEMLDIDKVE